MSSVLSIQNNQIFKEDKLIANILDGRRIKWAYKGASNEIGGQWGSIPRWLIEEINYALDNDLKTVALCYEKRRLNLGIVRGSAEDLEHERRLSEQKRLAAIYDGINEGGDGYNPYRY